VKANSLMSVTPVGAVRLVEVRCHELTKRNRPCGGLLVLVHRLLVDDGREAWPADYAEPRAIADAREMEHVEQLTPGRRVHVHHRRSLPLLRRTGHVDSWVDLLDDDDLRRIGGMVNPWCLKHYAMEPLNGLYLRGVAARAWQRRRLEILMIHARRPPPR
jgi:hypothetical protein